MMSSRGMGAINPSKMPKKKVIHRTDDPNDVDMYAEGGAVSKTEARKLAETVEDEGRFGKSFSAPDNEDFLKEHPKAQAVVKGFATAVKGIANLPRAATARKGRSEEEMSELTREVRRGMKAGGKTKSKVNQAGVYTKPGMRKSLFESIKAQAVQGTAAGQWSARKAQLLAKKYKAKGGGYK